MLILIVTKTNIIPITEGIMLFYREAFPMSYELAGCVLTSNGTTLRYLQKVGLMLTVRLRRL